MLHTAEGARDVRGLANFFARSGEASSHIATDARGDAIRMVADSRKAWTQAAFNPGSLSIEQCAFSAWNKKQWVRGFHKGLLRTAAAISNWSARHHIPIRHSVSHGVCQHKNLGAAGGGHSDCGRNYPERYVLYLAKLHYSRHHHKPRKRRTKLKLAAMKRYCHAVQRRYARKVLGTSL